MSRSSYFPSASTDQLLRSPVQGSQAWRSPGSHKSPINDLSFGENDAQGHRPGSSMRANREGAVDESKEWNQLSPSLRQHVPLVFPQSRMHLWDRSPIDHSAGMSSATAMPTIMFRKRQCRDLLLALTKTQARDTSDGLPLDLSFELTHREYVDHLPKTPGVQSNHGLLLTSVGTQGLPGQNSTGGNDVIRVPIEALPGSVQLTDRRGFDTQIPENRSLLENLDKSIAHSERIALRSFMRVTAAAKVLPASNDERKRKLYATLRFQAHAPATLFTLTPINTLPILKTALSLQIAGRDSTSPLLSPRNTGFVTLNKVRQAVLMLESDPELRSVPVVGVWIRLETPDSFRNQSNLSRMCVLTDQMIRYHPLAWVACERYISSVMLRERVWVEKNTFLMMAYCGPIVRCYEVSYKEASNHQTLQFSNLCFDVDINAFEDASEYSAADDFVISCKFGRSYDSVISRDNVHSEVPPSLPSPPPAQARGHLAQRSANMKHIQEVSFVEQETPLPRASPVPPPSPGPLRTAVASEVPSTSDSRLKGSDNTIARGIPSDDFGKQIIEQNELLKAMVSNQQGEMERLRKQLCELQAFAQTLASQAPSPQKEQPRDNEVKVITVTRENNEAEVMGGVSLSIEADRNISSDIFDECYDDDLVEEKNAIFLMEAPSDFNFDVNNPKPSWKRSEKTRGSATYTSPVKARSIYAPSGAEGLGSVETAVSAYVPALAPSRIHFSGSDAYKEEDLDESESLLAIEAKYK